MQRLRHLTDLLFDWYVTYLHVLGTIFDQMGPSRNRMYLTAVVLWQKLTYEIYVLDTLALSMCSTHVPYPVPVL